MDTASWDQEREQRKVQIALGRIRECRPGAGNSRVRQAAGEVEAAFRLQRPATLHAALVELHQALDEVEGNRTKRERARGRA